MKHIDEFQIAGTALLLCSAMFAISVVAPEGNTISKAVTNFIEAPETAAEAQAQAQAQAEDAGFTIYTQESNYDPEWEGSSVSSDSYETTDSAADIPTDDSSWEDTQPEDSSSSAPSDLPDDIAPEDDPTQIVYPSEPSEDFDNSDWEDTWEDTNDDWEVFPDESSPEDSENFYYDDTYYDNTDDFGNE